MQQPAHRLNSYLALLLTFFTMSSAPVSAEIFRWVDENGKIHFSDKPPANGKAETMELRINVYTGPEISSLSQPFASRDKVIMYGTSWCSYCKKAKRYFKKKGIAFVEYDIEKSRKGKREYKKLNGQGVPIILVGSKRLNGFSQAAFNQIYYGN